MNDPTLEAVYRNLSSGRAIANASIAVHTAIRDVLHTSRTRFWKLSQLDPNSKAYLGTRIEIELGYTLGLQKGEKLDFLVEGAEVDCKHTIGRAWMIPPEAINEICLLVKTDYDKTNSFGIGLIRALDSVLSTKSNRDKKKGLRCTHPDIRWVVNSKDLPCNVLSRLSDSQVEELLTSSDTATNRLAKLFEYLPGVAIPRAVIVDVVGDCQKDPMKRIRSNGGARDILKSKGLELLSGNWVSTESRLVAAGISPIGKDELIAVRMT